MKLFHDASEASLSHADAQSHARPRISFLHLTSTFLSLLHLSHHGVERAQQCFLVRQAIWVVGRVPVLGSNNMANNRLSSSNSSSLATGVEDLEVSNHCNSSTPASQGSRVASSRKRPVFPVVD